MSKSTKITKLLTKYSKLIGIDDLGDLVDILAPAVSDWYELGIKLRFEPGKLNEIEGTNKKMSRCLIEMLAAWFKLSKERNCLEIVAALRSKILNHKNIADELEDKYKI